MPARDAVIRSRIEAAERELAAAKAELARPEFEPDALYVIDNDGPKLLAYGRDLTHRDGTVRAMKFAYLDGPRGAGYVPTNFTTKEPLPGMFSPKATFTKVAL